MYMSETENLRSDTEMPSGKGSLGAALHRGWGGAVSGLQTGAIIGCGLTGAAFLLDAIGMGGAATHFLFHGADPLAGAVGLTAVHSVGAAAFEGACEAHDGYKGDNKEHDHIKDAAQRLDKELLALDDPQPPMHRPHPQPAYQFDGPQPVRSVAMEAILAQGPAASDEAWQAKLAARQQTLASAQERTV